METANIEKLRYLLEKELKKYKGEDHIKLNVDHQLLEEIIFFYFFLSFIYFSYYINIMMENLDWGTLNVPFLDVEEISSGIDID